MSEFPTFFSFDVETTATVVEAGELLTVGCVPVVRAADGWVKFPQHFYMRLDTPTRVTVERFSSLAWWREQSDEVRAEAYQDRDLLRFDRATTAKALAEWMAFVEPVWERRIFTANPVSFDKPWIDKLYYWADRDLPYHHRSLCLRSMKFGIDPTVGYGSDRTTHQSLLPHHALADADAQAQDLIDMLNGRW
jgi:hypothetical protein